MEYAKKYALIPENALNKNVPTEEHLNEFDREMREVLKSSLSDFEKVLKYYDILQRKQNLEKYNLPWMEKGETPVKSSAETPSSSENLHSVVLNSIPKTLTRQASSLWDFLKTRPDVISWNPQGELIINNKLISGSNLADIFHLVFTSKKQSVIGQDQFLEALQSLNAPQHFIKNPHLKKAPVKVEDVFHTPEKTPDKIKTLKKTSVKRMRKPTNWVNYKM